MNILIGMVNMLWIKIKYFKQIDELITYELGPRKYVYCNPIHLKISLIDNFLVWTFNFMNVYIYVCWD